MRNLPTIILSANLIPDYNIRKWKSKAKKVKDYKKTMDVIFNNTQEGFCAYCGLKMGRNSRRRIERDHVAPDSLHPEFRFHPNNLVAACSVCNGLDVKNATNTIVAKSLVYEDSTFSIVHPRLDDIHEYIEFSGDSGEIPFAKQISQKGDNHINLFDLRNVTQISLRRIEKELSTLERHVQIELKNELAARGLP